MSLRRKPHKHRPFHIIFAGSTIVGGWWIWRHALKKKRKIIHDQVVSCVLYHPYVLTDTRNICTANHWHATYWLRFVELIEPEPRRAIVQHTDTKRYHLMIQVPVEQLLPCDKCITPHEIFRLPVQDHYAYFVFIPQQGLDGFASLQQAQETAQTLSIPLNLHDLLLLEERKEDREEI